MNPIKRAWRALTGHHEHPDIARADAYAQPLDLTALTDEQLEAVRQDRLDVARAALGTPDFHPAIDRHTEVARELDRRLDAQRRRLGRIA